MKVRTWVEQEVEVDISVEEAIAELCAMPEADSRQNLLLVLNRCIAALRHVPDATLTGLEAKTRQIVADALRQQALRYDPGLALTRGEPVNAASPA